MTDETTKDRRERYEKIVRTVKLNCGGNMNPVAKRSSVKQTLCSHGDMQPSKFDTTLQAASDNDDVILGGGYVTVPSSRELVTDAIEYVIENSEDPQSFVAQANAVVDKRLGEQE